MCIDVLVNISLFGINQIKRTQISVCLVAILFAICERKYCDETLHVEEGTFGSCVKFPNRIANIADCGLNSRFSVDLFPVGHIIV